MLSPAGLFLVEIKSRPGTLEGDAHTWTWTTDGRRYSHDNPLILTNKKAKRLASLLRAQPALRGQRLPRLEPLVFLSAGDLRFRLTGLAATGAHRRGRPGQPGDDGIIAAMGGSPTGRRDPGRSLVNRRLSGSIAKALDTAGVRPSQARRRVGDYALTELLSEDEAYQDWQAKHVSLPRVMRRIRFYPYAAAMRPEQRTALRNAAEREYRVLEDLDHAGILRVREFSGNEHGPALIFDHDPDAVRLDLYLREEGAGLTVDQRLDLLRQLAETLKYAHDHGVFHRALTPQSILIAGARTHRPRTRVFNWQTAGTEAATGASATAGVGTINPEAFTDRPNLVYLAPELLHNPEVRGPFVDVFSLGAIAWLLFAGAPPADSAAALAEKLQGGGGLRLSDARDGVGDALQMLIEDATKPRVADRLPGVGRFLDALHEVEEELTAPAPEVLADPLSAGPGDRIDGGFTVAKRLGQGSTAVALLVTADAEPTLERVLKVAVDPATNDRIRREADALASLRHPNIVECHGVHTVQDRAAILMARAGDRTLAERLREKGRLSPDLLERFGEDLLGVVDHLEQAGIAHRDIKPENIGVAMVGKSERLHLVLFDFSLSGTPADNITAGTRPYRDPFLALRDPPRWDLHAERFAAAMTLYEMGHGTLPVWGDGITDPALLDDEISIDEARLDPYLRDEMAAFFRKALARRPEHRFDNAEDMLRAWRRVFEPFRQKAAAPAPAGDPLAEAARRAGPATPVADLTYSQGALSVLEDLGIHTVRELLAVDRRHFRFLRSVSERIRKEIRLTAKKLAGLRPDLVPGGAAAADQRPEIQGLPSLDELVNRLLPPRPVHQDLPEDRAVERLLGLDLTADDAAPPWPTPGDVAAHTGLDRDEVAVALLEARERWLKDQRLTALRGDVAAMLAANDGIMAGEELVAAVLAARGTTERGPRRRQVARAVVRAVLEAEAAASAPRARMVLRDGRAVAVAEPPGGAGADPAEPAGAGYALALGRRADEIAGTEPLPAPQRARELLLAVPRPDGVAPLGDHRLLQVAAGLSVRAALSSRLEVYPVGLPAARALALAAGSLVGPRELSVEQIRDRVQGRYPQAEPLPDRPALDALLDAVGAGLAWDPEAARGAGAYRPAPAGPAGSSGSRPVTRHTTDLRGPIEPTPAVADARDFEARLAHSAASGGFLALVAPCRRAAAAERELLHRRFGARRLSVDALLIDAMKAEAAALGADWPTVLRADAADRSGPDWRRLLQLVRRALPAVDRAVRAADRPVLLVHPGLLARYGLIDAVEGWRDDAGRPGGPPALWLLIPTEGPIAAPVIDGTAVPVLGPAQWARVPDPWICNTHRAGTEAADGG